MGCRVWLGTTLETQGERSSLGGQGPGFRVQGLGLAGAATWES